MADTTTVVEGKVKYRDGRKWKQRWCVLKKPSPVADRLQVLLYKDVKDAIKDGCKPKSCFPIENFYGLQSGFSYDKETNVVAIVCQKQIVLFSFENWEDLIQFEIQIRRNLGEEHQFKVQIVKMPSHSKLPNDYVRLLIHDQKFCFTSHAPPKLLQSWHICDLRRFGTVDGRFLFEGGSRCNKGAGLHAIKSEQSVEIGEIVHLASLGKIGSCQRNANKRGSQFSEAFESFNTFSNFFNNNQPRMGGDRANMLNCCNDSNLQDIDEMGRHKRHSISVMDYRRMAELTEKFKLLSMEKLERQRMLALYDIPPKSVREVGYQISVSTKNTKKPNTNRYSVSCSELKSGNSELSRILSDSMSQSYSTHVYSNTPFIKGYPSSSPNSSTVDNISGDNINLNSHYSHCYQKNKMSTINPLCIIEDETRTAFDRSKRLEAMQKLQKQECDLHKEISLLDEILQVCKTDDPKTDAQIKSPEPSFTERASCLPTKGQQESWDNPSYQIFLLRESCTKSSSHTNLHHSKPYLRTKISAPLPYVNLSQFDVGDDNGRVHLSKEGLVTGSTSSRSPLPRHSTPKKQLTESTCSRSSTDSYTGSSTNQMCVQEPIYANETRNDYDLKPPELPPKGQALLHKNKLSRNSSSFSQSSHTPPPLPPSRNRSRSLGSQGSFKDKADYSGSNTKIYSIDQVVSSPSKSTTEDTYLMMGSFQDEGKHSKVTTSVVSADAKRTSKGNADVMNCYMDMAALFQKESTTASTAEPDNNSPIYDTIDNPIESNLSPIPPIRESNYMIMEVAKSQRRSTLEESQSTAINSSHESKNPLCTKRSSVIQRLQTLQNYVSTTKVGEDNHNSSSIVIPKPIMPFQNLIGFKPQNLRSAGVYINPVNANVEESSNSPEPTSKKEEGFLARFKRRKSQDQSKACQSTENLLSNSKSSRTCVLEKSLSENGETAQNTPVKTIIRQRSSSFPNRRSFQEDEIDTLDMVNQSSKSDSLTDDVFPQWENEEQQSLTKGGCERKDNDLSEPEEKKEVQVLTVLHFQHQPPLQNFCTLFSSSKTDDEKMIEMLHTDKRKFDKKSNYALISELKSKLSLSFNKDVSNIAGDPLLPPFLPPKPRGQPTLSPVVELTPTTPQIPEQESIYVEMKEPAAKSLSRTHSRDKSSENNDKDDNQNEDTIPNIPN